MFIIALVFQKSIDKGLSSSKKEKASTGSDLKILIVLTVACIFVVVYIVIVNFMIHIMSSKFQIMHQVSIMVFWFLQFISFTATLLIIRYNTRSEPKNELIKTALNDQTTHPELIKNIESGLADRKQGLINLNIIIASIIFVIVTYTLSNLGASLGDLALSQIKDNKTSLSPLLENRDKYIPVKNNTAIYTINVTKKDKKTLKTGFVGEQLSYGEGETKFNIDVYTPENKILSYNSSIKNKQISRQSRYFSKKIAIGDIELEEGTYKIILRIMEEENFKIKFVGFFFE